MGSLSSNIHRSVLFDERVTVCFVAIRIIVLGVDLRISSTLERDILRKEA